MPSAINAFPLKLAQSTLFYGISESRLTAAKSVVDERALANVRVNQWWRTLHGWNIGDSCSGYTSVYYDSCGGTSFLSRTTVTFPPEMLAFMRTGSKISCVHPSIRTADMRAFYYGIIALYCQNPFFLSLLLHKWKQKTCLDLITRGYRLYSFISIFTFSLRVFTFSLPHSLCQNIFMFLFSLLTLRQNFVSYIFLKV